MKFFVPLAALAVFTLTACSTDANRRELYRPKQGDGYWTRSLERETYKNRELKDAQLPGPKSEQPAQR